MIRRHLQKTPLSEYFKIRHLFGLIGFSYLQNRNCIDPVGKNDPNLEGIENPYLWCIHFILMEKGILDEYPNAVKRANRILESIGKHDEEVLLEKYYVSILF